MSAETDSRRADRGMESRGLVLAPFRGVRYDAARVGDLAGVTAPPYDVITQDERAALESSHPCNVVRLILPSATGEREHGYAGAGRTLRTWLASGVLRMDPRPALYVYEQTTGDGTWRGILGALELRAPADRVVLPHEEVAPALVADRLAQMKATAANVEPILLAFQGGDTARDLIDQILPTPPVLAATTSDHTKHRIWAVSDQSALHAIATTLRGGQALIADGHHRYATYLQLQAEARTAGRGNGPWDRGFALLVDESRRPLQLQAIHRVLPRSAPELASTAMECAEVTPVPGLESGLQALDHAHGPALLISGDGGSWLVSDVNERLREEQVPADRPSAWRDLDVTVLHSVFLRSVWKVPEDAVEYVHDGGAALRRATTIGGSAVLLRPPEIATVLALARRGVPMPHKSTSFGPKPRSGFVLRVWSTEQASRGADHDAPR